LNPFTTEYAQNEIEFYGLSKHSEDGIDVGTTPITGRCDDYFNKWFWSGELSCPVFRIDKKIWMSLTPMEIQSAWVPIITAEGDVATLGLGMGYFALRAMKSDLVKSLTVFEIDDRVIKFFIDNFSDREGYDKVTIVPGDARMNFDPDGFDFAFVDIYKNICPDTMLEDVRNFGGSGVHFWGQEKLFLSLVMEEEEIDLTEYERCLISFWLRSTRNGYELSTLYSDHLDTKFAHEFAEAANRL
jgi:protein-L-isoaspartate O-methyltransferase